MAIRPFGVTVRQFRVAVRPFEVTVRPFGVTVRPFGACDNLLRVLEAHVKVMRDATQWQIKVLDSPTATDADRSSLIRKVLATMKVEEPKLTQAAAIARASNIGGNFTVRSRPFN
ncbi:hypothetical protein BV898_07904 [Hypsibius exemplaris]|uniref:Uncharacterized protein n=1 Tax=Hypsibius exemplaris TaxID=2072580 RepID=A0A1W0WRX8_HYPEX|nr:hypothetical protein BV898_07904 [Hypsibius exemplaris]